jgi:Uncharacterized Fe-S protein
MRIVARINVTPVKGMALQHPSRVELSACGIPGNRRFFLVDGIGELFSGGDHGQLVQVRPEHDAASGRLDLAFPDGTLASGPTDRLGPACITNFYGRGVPGREVLGPFSEALSDFVGRPVRLPRCDRDGDGADVEPLTAVSDASVRDLGLRGGRDDLDSRRFRINLELGGCEAYEEDTWDGQRVQVGGAVVRVGGQIPRCVVTTQSPDTGEKDWNTLTRIAKYRPRIHGDGGLPFGVYARVELPGSLHTTDDVVPLG